MSRQIAVKKPIPILDHELTVRARRKLAGQLAGGVAVHDEDAIVGEDSAGAGALELPSVERSVAAAPHDDELVDGQRLRAPRW